MNGLQLNPNGGDLQNISLLKAGHHIGINTVDQTLRNANLQIRSEPQLKERRWTLLNSTIEPDCSRPKLEIGGHLANYILFKNYI